MAAILPPLVRPLPDGEKEDGLVKTDHRVIERVLPASISGGKSVVTVLSAALVLGCSMAAWAACYVGSPPGIHAGGVCQIGPDPSGATQPGYCDSDVNTSNGAACATTDPPGAGACNPKTISYFAYTAKLGLGTVCTGNVGSGGTNPCVQNSNPVYKLTGGVLSGTCGE